MLCPVSTLTAEKAIISIYLEVFCHLCVLRKYLIDVFLSKLLSNIGSNRWLNYTGADTVFCPMPAFSAFVALVAKLLELRIHEWILRESLVDSVLLQKLLIGTLSVSYVNYP